MHNLELDGTRKLDRTPLLSSPLFSLSTEDGQRRKCRIALRVNAYFELQSCLMRKTPMNMLLLGSRSPRLGFTGCFSDSGSVFSFPSLCGPGLSFWHALLRGLVRCVSERRGRVPGAGVGYEGVDTMRGWSVDGRVRAKEMVEPGADISEQSKFGGSVSFESFYEGMRMYFMSITILTIVGYRIAKHP